MKFFYNWGNEYSDQTLPYPATLKTSGRFKIESFLVLLMFGFAMLMPVNMDAQVPGTVEDAFNLPPKERCTSKDLAIVSASLDLDNCNCTEGDEGYATLVLGIDNNTESTRTSFAFWSRLTLSDNDPSTDDIVYFLRGCQGPIPKGSLAPPDGITYMDFDNLEILTYNKTTGNFDPVTPPDPLDIGKIPYVCGTTLKLSNIYQAWTDASTSASRQCPAVIENSGNINPKCGVEPEIEVSVGLTASPNFTNVSCYGGADGTVTLEFSGGTSPYLVSFNSGDFVAQTSPKTYTGLAAGTYNWDVKDSSNPACIKSGSTTVGEPDEVTLSISETDVSCNGAADGSISVDSFSGTGTAEFFFSSDGTNFSSSSESSIEGAGYGPGTYYVRVAYDGGDGVNNACTKTESVTISQPDAVTLSISKTDVSCSGAADGSITVNSFSGTGTAEFFFSSDGTNFSSSSESSIEGAGYGPGTYYVRVAYDGGDGVNNACTKTESVTISQPDAVTLSISKTDVSCSGAADGSISVDSFSGTGTAEFFFSSDGTNFSSSSESSIEGAGYGPGTYYVRVAYDGGDGVNNACTKTESVTISQPDAVTLSISKTDVFCSGAADGSISVDSFSGTGTAEFFFSSDGTNFSSSSESSIEGAGYGPGTYYVRVAYDGGDGVNNACTKTESVTISQPDAVTLSISKTDVSCSGAADGSISVDSFSGTGTAEFFFSSDGTNFSSSSESSIEGAGYGPGTYYVRVAYDGGDGVNNACTKTESVTISQPDAVTLSISKTDVSCSGAADGSITVNSFSGTGTAEFFFSSDGTNFSSSSESSIEGAGYGPGTYYVRVAYDGGDGVNNACTKTESVTISQPDAVTLSISKTDVSCSGAADGSISVDSFSGTGTAEFFFSSDGTNFSSSSESSIEGAGYGPGTYYVRVAYDGGDGVNNACTKTESVTITQPGALNLTLTPSPETCSYDDGSISLQVSGGTGPYEYSFDGLVYVSALTLTGLSAGSYTIYVRDFNSCTDSETVIVLGPGNCIVDQGCTPGYWKNHLEAWKLPADYTYDSDFFVFFGIDLNDPDPNSDKDLGNNVQDIIGDMDQNADGKLTLLEAISAEIKTSKNSGWFAALARHAVAAYLNASNPDVGYEFSTFYILTETFKVFTTDYQTRNAANSAAQLLHNRFRIANERVCPLGNETRSALAETSVLKLADPVVVEESVVVADFSVSPVPFRESLSVRYDFDYISNATIQMFDLQGRLLFTQQEVNASKGKITDLSINFRILPSQIYVVKVTTDRDVFTKKIVSDK